jgi:MoxR-like ATPase
MLAAMVATLPKPEAALRPEVLEAEVEKQVTAAFDARVPRVIHVEYKGTVREVSGVKNYLFDDVLAALAARQHVWLPGPAGSGKSTLARQCGEALGYSEPEPNESENTPKRIHMTGAIETPFQLLGYVSPNGDARTLFTPFRKAWQYGGLFIFDDVDRSNSKALAAFNEPLANGHCAFPDGVIKMHADCLIVATANTFGLGGSADYVGAARLDKATLDRFVYIEVPYDEKAERLIAGPDGTEWCLFVQKVRGACRRLGLKHLVTPRATYKGLALMRAGMSRDKVEAATVYAGLDPETITRIRGAF